jgi:hypothetical protein
MKIGVRKWNPPFDVHEQLLKPSYCERITTNADPAATGITLSLFAGMELPQVGPGSPPAKHRPEF